MEYDTYPFFLGFPAAYYFAEITQYIGSSTKYLKSLNKSRLSVSPVITTEKNYYLSGGYTMADTPISSLTQHISTISDPRRHNVRHMLHDMLMIAICAIISGADSWTQVAEYGRSKQEWFSRFLALPSGIPSHDTFGRLFAMLDPKAFQDFFLAWINTLGQSLDGKAVAIDGKTLRRSHDRADGKCAIHMISAYATELGLVLGQLKTEAKSNEITAIPQLIETLDLKGAIVTIDAMGCQKKIARCIIDAKADYILQVKDNQKNLHEDLQLLFDNPPAPVDHFQTIDADHGRIEIRRYATTDDIAWLQADHQWAGIKSITMACRQREVDGMISNDKAYFISSLESDATKLANAIRAHWSIENKLHWCLDIAFREDDCRVRKGNASENLAILRHIAINLLKREKTLKGGIQTKRLKAAWDHNYLLKVLAA